MFVGAHPKVEQLKGDSIEYSLDILTNIRLALKARDKLCSLLQALINYDRKKFCNIGLLTSSHCPFQQKRRQSKLSINQTGLNRFKQVFNAIKHISE
jgi:hypothetical protein